MELKNTVDLMLGTDFKDRFKAEYYQLDNRITGLQRMLIKYKAGTLGFTVGENSSYYKKYYKKYKERHEWL